MRRGLLILLLTTVWGCTQGDAGLDVTVGEPISVESTTVTFVLDQVYRTGDDEGDLALSEITYAAGDSVGNLYVYDRRSNLLAGFGADGSVSWVNQTAGRGPGEINGIWGIAINDGHEIVVANQNMSRIDRFASDGSYLSSLSTMESGLGRAVLQGFLDSGELVRAMSMPGKFGTEISVVGLEDELRLTRSFTVDQSDGIDIPEDIALMPTTSTTNGRIVVGNLRSYEYTVYNDDGSVYRQLMREDVQITPPLFFGSELGLSWQELSRMEPLLHITDDYWVGGGSWPTQPIDTDENSRSPTNGPVRGTFKKTRVIDLFEVDSESLIASFSATSLGIRQLLASGGGSVIFAELDNEFPSIGRFRVEIETAR